MLGYGYGRGLYDSSKYFGEGTGDIIMTYVRCRGEETSLLDCHHGVGNLGCSHADDVGVQCWPDWGNYHIRVCCLSSFIIPNLAHIFMVCV